MASDSDNAPSASTVPAPPPPSSAAGSQQGSGSDAPDRGGTGSEQEEKADEPMTAGSDSGDGPSDPAPGGKSIADHVLPHSASSLFDGTQGFPTLSRAAPGVGPATPSRIPVPATYSTGKGSFLVGIPAWSTHAQQKRLTCDGYAGLEVLTEVESLSATDLADLSELVSLDEDVEGFFLRPRDRNPESAELETMLGSTLVKREMGAILMQYEARGLAERVFSMTTFMRRLLVKHRDMRAQVESLGSNAVAESLKLREENAKLRRDYSMLKFFYEDQLETAVRELSGKQTRRRDDLRRVIREHDAEMVALREEVVDLRAQLDEASSKQRDLKKKLRTGSFRVPRLMNFLNQNNTKTGGNWERLRELLVHFKAGSPVPTGWKTLINVTSADDVFADPGPYAVELDDEDSDDESKNDDDPVLGGSPHIGSAQTSPPPRRNPRRAASSGQSKGTPRKSARQVPAKAQWRPTEWKAVEEDARSPDQALVLTEQAACASLEGLPVVWRKLRTDMQLAILAGMGYKGAIELLSNGDVAHTLFHPKPLGDMLARMMYWNRLDETPWTRHVPEVYFLRAENRLEDLWTVNRQPDFWPELRDVTADEGQEILGGSGSEHDNEAEDETWDPSEEPDEQVERTLEFQSPRKRRRGSVSASSSTPASSTASTAKKLRPESRRRQSSLARKSYESLTPSELAVIETPSPGITSWRHNGILTTFAPSTAHAVDQSLGFPDYVPNRNQGMAQLRARWNEKEHSALMAMVPWKKMFRARAKDLILHRRSELSEAAKTGLDKYVGFMEKNAKAFWMAGHWTTFDTDLSDYAEDEVKARKKLHDSASKGVITQVERLKATGIPSTIFHEPGVWTYPAKTCAWILMDESTKNAQGRSHTLAEQLEIVDRREPARAQWTSCATDEERIAHLPDDIRAMLLPAAERQNNPVSLKFQ